MCVGHQQISSNSGGGHLNPRRISYTVILIHAKITPNSLYCHPVIDTLPRLPKDLRKHHPAFQRTREVNARHHDGSHRTSLWAYTSQYVMTTSCLLSPFKLQCVMTGSSCFPLLGLLTYRHCHHEPHKHCSRLVSHLLTKVLQPGQLQMISLFNRHSSITKTEANIKM